MSLLCGFATGNGGVRTTAEFTAKPEGLLTDCAHQVFLAILELIPDQVILEPGINGPCMQQRHFVDVPRNVRGDCSELQIQLICLRTWGYLLAPCSVFVALL
ncbi:UNVERIFIED_CONTAM: hypothetical protein K2H54_018079 [Gekko kuhli]